MSPRLPLRLAKAALRRARRLLDPSAPVGAPVDVPLPPPLRAATSSVSLSVEATPNPNARKFTADRTIVDEGSLALNSAEQAASHPLGAALFALDGVRTVFAVRDFVTVTKSSDVAWDPLTAQIEATLADILSR